MSETLEWYAKRGLLSASDEDKSCNDARLSAGRRVSNLFLRNSHSRGLVSQYEQRVGQQGSVKAGSLNAMEQQAHQAHELSAVLSIVPPRTRRCIELVCLNDERVGKPMMERLRCGLDAISQFYTKSKNMC